MFSYIMHVYIISIHFTYLWHMYVHPLQKRVNLHPEAARKEVGGRRSASGGRDMRGRWDEDIRSREVREFGLRKIHI